jgi:hypothetical protein
MQDEELASRMYAKWGGVIDRELRHVKLGKLTPKEKIGGEHERVPKEQQYATADSGADDSA